MSSLRTNTDSTVDEPEGVIASVTPQGQFLVQAKLDRNSKESDDETETDRPSETASARSDLPSPVPKQVSPRPKKTSRCPRFFSCFFPKSQPRRATGVKKTRETQFYLPAPLDEHTQSGKKTLVLDLDETLVHSSFRPVPNADFIVPVEIEGMVHHVYVCKRPHVDRFLQEIGPLFETVVFTASLSKYADPVVDLLDATRVVAARLFREHCVQHCGNFVKDLSVLGRDLRRTVIIDNAPSSYIFHPENALPCSSWFDDPHDTELLEFIPILKQLAKVDDVRNYLENLLQQNDLARLPSSQ